MDYLPIFLRVQNRLTVVVGGGAVAARKAELLLKCGAQVRLVAPELAAGTRELLRQHTASAAMSHLSAAFADHHLEGATLVIAATDSAEVNAQVSQFARSRHIPVNVADDAEHSDFILPAIVDRAPVIVAVSSAGTTPVLARRLREQIESLLPAHLGTLARFAGRQRERVNQALRPALRRPFWERFFGAAANLQRLAQDESVAQEAFTAELHAFSSRTVASLGEVYLIGAGPGDPDLLTLRALQLLQQADVLLYDRLVSPAILDRARREATRVFVGKEVGESTLSQERINELLVEHARRGLKVARLKGGDPFVFGRGGEEIAALARHHIPVTVVPGITAALGAAASAQIPLTLRDVSQSVTFAPGHVAVADTLDWPALARSGHTVVFYMAMAQLAGLTQRLRQAGAPADRPVALIAQATLPTQRVVHGTLADIAETARTGGFGAPALLFVGDVTRVVQQQALASLEPCLEGVA
ncbi:MAG TPA: siroheme synthase CysG [Steroidobacteraceae bacterium]|jgi:uroporphyrin-III C-methyltransferase/precorrin-2 dehydrogenase/sirohydrochlorin ferrochelatase